MDVERVRTHILPVAAEMCRRIGGNCSVSASENRVARGQPHHIVGRKGRLDHPQLIVRLGFEFQDDATFAEFLGLQDYVVLTATVDVGDWVP